MKKFLKRVPALLLVLVLIAAYAPLSDSTAEATQYYYFKSPAANASVKAGSKVAVNFWAGVEISETKMDAWGNPASTTYSEMPVTLKVFKGGTEIYSKEFKYTRAKEIQTSYTPTTTGTLKLCIYGRNLGLNNYTQELQATRTIKVTKAKASYIKKVKPKITVERIAKKKAQITCVNNYGYGMKIYRATSKNGKYKLIKTTSKDTYTDTSIAASKVYYYKVKIYAKSGTKKYLSKWSAKTAAEKYFSGIKLTSVSSGVKVTWKKVSGTGYYLIRRSTKGVPGEDDVIECVGSETTSIVDKEAKKGTTYYYSVTAYKGDDSKIKAYSGTGYKIKYTG